MEVREGNDFVFNSNFTLILPGETRTKGSVTSVFFFCENLQWWEAKLFGIVSCYHLLVAHTLTQSVSLSEYSFSESTYFIEYLWGFSKIVDRELQCSFKAYSKWSIHICCDWQEEDTVHGAVTPALLDIIHLRAAIRFAIRMSSFYRSCILRIQYI